MMVRNLKTNIRSRQLAFALLIVACFSFMVPAQGQGQGQETERPVRLKDVPQAVQLQVRNLSRGANVRGLSVETKDSQTYYEVSLNVKGRIKDVLIDPEGKIVEIEEQIPLASLPPAAKGGIVKHAGKGRILVVESITKDNTIVAYEAHVRTAGKISEIKVDPDGKLLPPE